MTSGFCMTVNKHPPETANPRKHPYAISAGHPAAYSTFTPSTFVFR